VAPHESEDGALYPAEIQIVASLVDGDEVPVAHTGRARYSIDESGRRWVRKLEENIGCEELLAEAISWLLATRLDVPVPPAALYKDPEGLSWLSGLVDAVVHWDSSHAPKVSNVDGLGAVLALDALVQNPDRHAGNLLVQPVDAVTVRVWAIDHGQALVGWPDDFLANANEITSIRNLIRGLPIDLLEESAANAARKATKLSHSEIMSMVRGACLLTKETKADVIGQTLSARCADAERLVTAYVKSIREASR
jgi:hypothetical protein